MGIPWVAGSGGNVYRFSDDGKWTEVGGGVNEDFRALSVVVNGVWAAGKQGFWHLSDGAWRLEMTWPEALEVTELEMVSDNLGWVVGFNGAVIEYRNGQWRDVYGAGLTDPRAAYVPYEIYDVAAICGEILEEDPCSVWIGGRPESIIKGIISPASKHFYVFVPNVANEGSRTYRR
jgi:hypothetical protein